MLQHKIRYFFTKIFYGFLRIFGIQDWIRFGIRFRLLEKLVNIDNILPLDFEINFYGLKYKGNLRNSLDWNVYFLGAYGKWELALLKDLVSGINNPVCLDVGSNVGQHSIFMSKYCKEVHSFEPYEKVSEKMLEKIKINNIKNIFVHKVGLGRADEDLYFYMPTGLNHGVGSFLSDYKHSKKSGINKLYKKLKVFKADDHFYKLGIKRVDIIKIDVEGFEKNVLLGMKNILERNRPFILMEFTLSTKKTFSGIDDFYSVLPDKYEILGIISDVPFLIFFDRPKYKFVKFDFDKPTRMLLLRPIKND